MQPVDLGRAQVEQLKALAPLRGVAARAEIVAVKNGVLLKQKKDGSAVPAPRPATSAG